MRALLAATILALAANHVLTATIKLSNKATSFGLAAGYDSRIFETELNETLECLRYTLETGLPEYGIPSLRSIEIPDVNLNLGDLGLDGTSGYVHVLGGVLNGLTDFYASDLSFSVSLVPVGFRIAVTLVIPNFYLELDYDMDMVGDGIPVYGNGKATIDWKDVSFEIGAFVGIGTTIYVTDISFYINIEESDITITGWFNDDEHSQVVTDLVNDYLIPQWINEQSEEINEVVSPVLELVINLLIGLSTGDDGGTADGSILAGISENCDGRELMSFVKYLRIMYNK